MKINETNFGVLVSYVTHVGNVSLDSVSIVQLRTMVQECDATPQVPVERPLVNPSVVHDLLSNMNQPRKKIEAIKAWRMLTGEGLKEAKDAVERYWNIS